VVCPGDVTGPARAGSANIDRTVHGRDYIRMLAHAQVVVRAPNRNLQGTDVATMDSLWEPAIHALEIDKMAVAALSAKSVEFALKEGFICHDHSPGV
jgi:hypothetical protein